jgi:hypothetical protein
VGEGGNSGGAGSGTRIVFTGTGSGSAISARSTFGVEFHDMEIAHTSASFTGTLIDFSATGTKGSAASRGGDTQHAVIAGCRLSGQRSAATMIDLDNAIITKVRDSIIYQGLIGVRGRASASTYSNVAKFDNVTFLGNVTVHVSNAGINWNFDGCTFEQLYTAGGADGAAGALSYDGGVSGVGVKFSSCYMGDSDGTGTWVAFAGSGLNVSGCYISTCATCITTGGSAFGVVIAGNVFLNSTTAVTFGASNRGVKFEGNDFQTVTNVWTGTKPTGSTVHSTGSDLLVTSDAPATRVRHDADQAAGTSGALTTLTFNTEVFDTDSIHSTSSNATRLTCRTAGKYMVGANVRWQSSAAGTYRYVQLLVNGTTRAAAIHQTPIAATAGQNIVTIWEFAVGDYVEVGVIQDSGGSLNVLGGVDESPVFWMAQIA